MPGAPHAMAQVFDGPGQPLRWCPVPLPTALEPGQVLVELTLATVCGSDLHTIDGRRTEPTPAILGHEGVGRVVATGGGRQDVSVGDRVTWTIADSCGICPYCVDHGLPEKCRRLFKYGHAPLGDGCGLHGTYATHVLVRAGTGVVPVPETLTDALVAPANCALATAVNIVAQVPANSRSVLVQGAGLLGLYACALLRDRGVDQVWCADPLAQRQRLAARFGAEALGPLAGDGPDAVAGRERLAAAAPDGVDAVLEVAGVRGALDEGLEAVRAGGAYVWAGLVHPDSDLAGIRADTLIRKCLTVRGVHNYAPRHLREAVGFLGRTAERYPFHELVSPPVPLSSLDEALDLSRQRRWPRVAVTPGPP